MKRAASSRVRQAVQLTTLIAVFALLGVRATGAQNRSGATLTNADVVQMVKAGKSDSAIIAAIRSRNVKFDFSGQQLLDMHDRGVSSAVLQAMFTSGGGAPAVRKSLEAQLAVSPRTPKKTIRMASNPRVRDATATILTVLQKQRQAADAEIAQTKLRVQTSAQTGLLGGPAQPQSAAGAAGTPTAQAQTAQPVGATNAPRDSRVSLAPSTTLQRAPASGLLGAERTSSASSNTLSQGGLLTQGGNTTAVQNTRQVNGSPSGSGTSGTGGANGNMSRIVRAPRTMQATALICAQDPSFRIITVSGSSTPGTFTPADAYNLYTIKGCSFGDQAPTASQEPTDWVHVYGPGTFNGQFEIKFWSDNEIDVSLDPSLSGYLDLHNLTLVVKRKDGQQTEKGGFSFYAARQPVLLRSIPSSWVKLPAMWNGPNALTSTYYSPVSTAPDAAVRSSGATAYVHRFFVGAKFDPTNVSDYYDLSHLAPGWTADPQNPPELTPYDANCPGAPYTVTYKESFGMWTAQWDGDGIRVTLEDTSCSGVVVWAPWGNYSNLTSSFYGLKVWVIGPRGTDPMTGLATH
jgi:hypothetical protein